MNHASNLATACLIFAATSLLTAQENWPQFRGEGANGIGAGNPPTQWDVKTGENVLWKTAIEGLGHSAPIVWGDSVFITTAVSADSDKPSLETGWVGGSGEAAPDSGIWTWKVICLDRNSGKIKWTRTASSGEPTIERHLKATHANCTAATDGNCVVAFFGSEGLHCYDFEGELKWKKDFGRLHSGPYNSEELEWGFASSPVIHNGHVVVQCDCLNIGFVSILNLEDGTEVRRIVREDVATWSTPCVVNANGKSQIVCNGYKQMAAYDFETGDLIWTLSGGGDVPVPTPLFHEDKFFVTNGHGRSPVYAVAADAKGDITPKEGEDLPEGLAWYQPRGGSYMPTPIIVGDLLYTCNDSGVLTVRDTATGEKLYKRRVWGGKNTFSASAVATSEHLYFASESGNVIVAKTGREFEHIATNDMRGIVMATPAMAGDQLFVRTVESLVCIAEKPIAEDDVESSDEGD